MTNLNIPSTTVPLRQFIVTEEELKDNPALDPSNLIVVKNKDDVVDRCVQGVFYSSASKASPQGNLDAGNSPHVDPGSRGFITSQGITRKVRDFLFAVKGLPLHVRRNGVMLQSVAEAVQAMADAGDDTAAFKALIAYNDAQIKAASEPGKAPKKKSGKKAATQVAASESDDQASESEGEESAASRSISGNPAVEAAKKEVAKAFKDPAMAEKLVRACCKQYIDTRLFGRLILAGVNIPILGPCQFDTSQSLHPVELLDIAVTCGAVSDHAEKADKDRNIGRKMVVDFGLYQTTLCVSPVHAAQTGMTWRDLGYLLEAMVYIWEISKSSTKAGMEFEAGYLFQHDAPMPLLSLSKARRLVTPTSPGDSDLPRSSMADYTLADVDKARATLPKGVKLLTIS